MRALCSKSIFHVFSVFKPTRLAKKDISRNVQNPIWALGFETKNQTPSVIHRYSFTINVIHWDDPSVHQQNNLIISTKSVFSSCSIRSIHSSTASVPPLR